MATDFETFAAELLERAAVAVGVTYEELTAYWPSPMPVTHFVGFPDKHGRQYQNAVRTFGPPDFMHRFWDQRAKRDIAEGDLVVFAEGDEHQPVRRWNGDDQFYNPDPTEPRGEIE